MGPIGLDIGLDIGLELKRGQSKPMLTWFTDTYMALGWDGLKLSKSVYSNFMLL